jgi:transposase
VTNLQIGSNQAIEALVTDYGAKWPKAVAKVVDDRDALLALFDYAAEHWVHLRTTNPIWVFGLRLRIALPERDPAGHRWLRPDSESDCRSGRMPSNSRCRARPADTRRLTAWLERSLGPQPRSAGPRPSRVATGFGLLRRQEAGVQQPDGVAGIDAHKHVFSVAVLDGHGGRCAVASFATSPKGLAEALALLDSFEFAIGRIGVEGSAGLGRHVTQALVAAGYDVREVQANRTAERRRRRRRHKTDREDAEAIARETLAEPNLPPAGKQRRPDPDWEELVAVGNRRKSLIGQRVRLLNEAEAVLTGLPLPVRAALPATSRVRPRLRALQRGMASTIQVAAADRVNLAWLIEAAGDIARLDARVTELDKKIPALLGRLGRTLTQEYGIAAVGAMDLLVEVGDPSRFATEAQFARWCGVAPVAVSSGEGDQAPPITDSTWPATGR